MKHRNWINGIIVCILLVSAGLTTLPTKSAARVTPVGSEPGAPAGTVHYVKPGASGSCASWTAACELQNALGKATTGDEIWVAEGTYTPGTYRGDTFQLVEGVGVYGGFAGTETVRSQRDWTAHSCVLSGEIGSGDVITDNVEHVVNGSGVTAAAVLDGFTITGAYAVYDCSPDFDPFCYPEYYGGGGMRIRDGSPVVANLTFVDNEATWGGGLYNGGNATSWMTHMSFVNNRATSAGGGMYNQEANPALTHVTFHANSAPYAAGMYNLQGNPTLTHVTFTGNTAGSGPSGYAGAGGMGNFAGNPILHDVTFAGNTASGSVSGAGGGMSNDSFTLVDIYPTLIDVTFSDNVATTRGGGMSNGDYSHPKLTNVIFEGNTATDGGAIMNDYASSPTLTNVRFVGNSATGKGGGIYNNNKCHPTLTNVVFSGNTAFDGGGMNTYYTYGGNVTLANVTFHGNSATNAGGAMYNGGPQAIAIVTNSVLWGNTAPVGAQIHNAWPAGAANVTYSDIQGGWSGTGNIDVDPQFVDPDGPDGVLGTLDDSLRLTLTPVSAAASPIDAGTNAAVPAGVSTDLDGNPRIWPTAGNVDMGAYEVPYVARGVSPPPHILRVKPDGGAGSCADWDHACALQHALNWAPALNGEVWIAGGVYTPTFRTDSGDPRSATFPLLSGTPLYSGFAGDETARDQRDPGANVTVLSGDLGGDDDTDGDGVVLTAAGIRGSNAYHVVSGYDDLTAIDVLEAFVITGGQATGATPDDRGGGVYNAGGSPTLVNLRLSGNTAGQTGGGFYNDGGDPLLANLTFHGNSAGTSGSAIGSDADGLTLANSILWGNAPVQTPIAGSAALTLTHTLVQGGCPAGASCDAIIDDDPQFVSAAAGDLTLACASPALDAGDNDAVPAGVTADLAGNPRFSGIYGAPQVDMGAYEEQYYGDQVTLGHDKLQTGSAYRTGFHQGPGDTIQVTLDAYDPTPLIAADQHFANALTCVGRTAERREHALRGRLDTRWELATGGLLLGNDAMVRALDMRLLPTCPGSQPSLGCQLARLEVARGHLVAATDSYLELLSGDLYTTILALQPTRSSPLADGPATYADIVRLAEAASRESRAYLELAERQFRQYTLAGKSEADATLREGFDRATAGLALLDRLTEGWSGATNNAAYQAAYQALTQNIADMQRMFTYLAHDKNPLGYEAGYVPFYLHFDEAHGGVPLEESNFVAAHDIAQATYSQADQKLEALLGTQRDLDDNETALGEALAELDAEYRAELIELCGADGIEPDLAYCHQNEAGTMYDQLLALQSAHLRVDKVYQEMENQLALIRIEQARAARVAGLQRATASMYTETGEKLADLAQQEATLRFSKSNWGNFSSVLRSTVSGAMAGGELGQSFSPWGAIAGGGINLILGIGDAIDEAKTAGKLADIAAKRETIEAYQLAEVKYEEAAITDADSEALIKTYMLAFAELDVDLALAVNELEREIAQLKGMKERVEYLLAGWSEARQGATALYLDPAARILRDWQAEDATTYFETALSSAYEAARALDYEIAEMWGREDEVYGIVDIAMLDNYLFDMNQTYDNWIESKSFAPEATVLRLSRAMGFIDSVDRVDGQPVVVTARQKFNAYVSNPANWTDIDGDGQKESLELIFQTSIFNGNPVFDAGVHNDKIHKFSIVLEGDEAALDGTGNGTRVRLTQSGTSFVRHEDAWNSGQDRFAAYNLAPHTANVDALINSVPGGAPWLGTEWSPGLWWRSVGCSKWSLTIDRERAAGKNSDLDLAALEEITLHILHRNFALPGSGPPSASGAGTVARTTTLAADAESADRYGGTVVPCQPERLPQLDVSLVITESNGLVSGFLDASAALGYPVLDPTSGRGPALSGTLIGGELYATSEVFMGAGDSSRQVVLHTSASVNTAGMHTGVYTETVWGVAPHPLVMTGELTLMDTKPHGPQGLTLYLPIISK